MALIYIVIIIAGATAIWPIGRWSTAGAGSAAVLGFWISLTAAVAMALFLLITGRPILVPPVWIAGLAFGLAYAIGFCILIIGSLKIGPMSLTTAMNNLAMLWGILYAIFILKSTLPSLGTIIGIVGVCLAMILIGIAGLDRRSQNISRKWLAMVTAGSALAGVSFIAQTYIGTSQANHAILFSFAGNLIAAGILAPIAVRAHRRASHRREPLGGLIMGIIACTIIPLTIAAINRAGPSVIFPLTVASPIILVLFLGHFLYHEHLRPTSIAACILGALSLALLAHTG